MPSICDLIHGSLTKGVQGLGADFRRKSEIRKPALWGGKAGTDRVREGIPEGFHPTEQACALWRRGSARP